MIRMKLVPLALAGCLIITGMPGTVYGAEISTSNEKAGIASIDIPATGEIVVTDTGEDTSENLTQVIKTVKKKITIPSQLSKFDYSYNANSYNGEDTWSLNWYTEDGSRNISVQCDTEGNIISFYAYQEKSENYVPKYLKADLKSKADKFLKKVAPDISGKVRYVNDDTAYYYASGRYNYVYQRVENGIPMPDNRIVIGVNYETGTVTSYYTNWLFHAEIPSAETKISKEEAAKKLGKALNIKLAYKNAYTTDSNGKGKIKAFLVYVPENSSVSVDAKTGEVYTTKNELFYAASEEKASGGTYDRSTNSSDSGLTKEELSKVSENKGLISKETAIKTITGNKNLLLSGSLKSITASLYQRNYYDNNESAYVWCVDLSDPKEGSGAYASATIDAKTGKIISFYSNGNNAGNGKAEKKYSKEQGQKIFEEFLKEQIPDKFKNAVLSKEDDVYRITEEENSSGNYYYNYNRVNEGIEYIYNRIYGAVDSKSGKISDFSYYWTNNVTFESPKNIISAKDATELYLANESYHLVYEVNSVPFNQDSKDSSYKVDNKVRLVYRTDLYPANISPFTGKQLDENGNEYVPPSEMYKYKDISNTASARNIRLLAEIGIGFKGGEFKPDIPITTKELTEFISQAGIYYNSGKYKLANDSSAITRVEAAKFAVQILGYEEVAKIKGIYAPNFKDQDQISSEDLGYVALAQGLNLVTANSNNEFRPKDKLTRAEAADLIIAMLSIEK